MVSSSYEPTELTEDISSRSSESYKNPDEYPPAINDITKNISVTPPVSPPDTSKDLSAIPPTEILNTENYLSTTKDLSNITPKENPNKAKDLSTMSSTDILNTENFYSSQPLPKVEDGVIDSTGGLVVSGEEGSIQLDKDDQIAAGTNLGGSVDNTATKQDSERMERYQAESIALLKRISVATAASGVGSMVASIAYSGFDAVKAESHYGTKFR